MKSGVAVCLVIVATAAPAGAQRAITAFKTGNDLYAECGEETTDMKALLDYASCHGYIFGSADTFASVRAEQGMDSCLATGVTGKQVADTVMQYIKEHPAERNQPANYLVDRAILPLFTKCPADTAQPKS